MTYDSNYQTDQERIRRQQGMPIQEQSAAPAPSGTDQKFADLVAGLEAESRYLSELALRQPTQKLSDMESTKDVSYRLGLRYSAAKLDALLRSVNGKE